MLDLLAKIYIGLLIGSGLLGFFLRAVRVLRRSPERIHSQKHMLRRNLLRDCGHLMIGLTALALFSLGVLGGLGVLVVGGITLILLEYALVFLIKPLDGISE